MTDAADIPVLQVTGRSLPEAWERAVIAVWDNGTEVRTEYDSNEDPPSLDATAMVTVENPMGEPRLHKNIPGGPTELEVYRQEVVEGIHDHWINPEEGKWTYTYHERLFAYCPVNDLQKRSANPPFAPVNQIDYIVDKLAEAPYSRRAQAITWMPQADPSTYDPPCLQRLWGRLLPEDEGFSLNFNAHWRSRDLLMAWFMNVYAMTDLQSVIAERLSPPVVEPGLGLDDANYIHEKGMITKKEIRIQGLSELNIQKGETIWDLGAGSGAVAIEASWLSGSGRVYAVEKEPERIAGIEQNVANTCKYNVHPVQGEIAASLDNLPDPDRIFIGGGAGKDISILENSVQRIKPGGRIVLHFVLLNSFTNALQFCRKNELEYRATHVRINRSSELQGDVRFSPLNPVYILTVLID